VHAEGLVQETPPRLEFSASDGLGLGTIDHVEPSHDSMRVSSVVRVSYSPTVVHADALVHETPESPTEAKAVGGVGLETNTHADPVHASIRVWKGPE
jgi:hypothetical protein